MGGGTYIVISGHCVSVFPSWLVTDFILEGDIRSAKWALTDGILYFQGKIYVPDASKLCHCIIALCHDFKVARHSGRWKTLELVSQNYWWPQMSRYIDKYVSTCDMCLWTKASCQPLQWTPSPSDSQCPMGHYKHRLHCQAAQISWSQFCYGHGRLHHQVCSLHRHSDHSLRRWDCSTLSSTHVETPWSPTESSLGLRSSVHGRIHKGTLLVAWNHIGCHHPLPSPRGWPNGMGQPRVGAIPLAVYQSETG